jgi:hypothetical protein
VNNPGNNLNFSEILFAFPVLQKLKNIRQEFSKEFPDFVKGSFSKPTTSAFVAHPLMRKVFGFSTDRTLLFALPLNRLKRVFCVTRFTTPRAFAAKPSVITN